MKDSINLLIRSNLFVALCATSLAWQTKLLSGSVQNDHVDLIVVFLSTLFVYNFHRLIKNRQYGHSNRNLEANKNYSLNRKLSVVSLALLVFCFFYFGRSFWEIFLLGGVLALGYSFRFLPWRGKLYSLRTAPYAKLFVVVLVWVIMTVILPLDQYLVSDDILFLILGERLLFLLAITLPFDIKDMNVDMNEQISTIPNRYGWNVSVLISRLTITAFAVVVVVGYLSHLHHLFSASALLISAVVTYVIIKKSTLDSGLVHYAFYLEGASLIQSLLVWISYLIYSFI